MKPVVEQPGPSPEIVTDPLPGTSSHSPSLDSPSGHDVTSQPIDPFSMSLSLCPLMGMVWDVNMHLLQNNCFAHLLYRQHANDVFTVSDDEIEFPQVELCSQMAIYSSFESSVEQLPVVR